MESSIAVFLLRQSACERLPTKSFDRELTRGFACDGAPPFVGMRAMAGGRSMCHGRLRG